MNSNKLGLLLNVIKFGLAGLGVILAAFLFMGPNAETTMEVQTEFREGSTMNAAIYYFIAILLAGAGLVLLFFLFNLISQPKKTVMSIIGIIVALVIYLIFSMMGSADTNESLALRDPVEQGTINSTTAGIFTVGFILVVAVIVTLWGTVKKFAGK